MSINVEVLRLGHRPAHDRRLSTHVGLTARALGASRMHVSRKDYRVKESVERVVERWGGDFEVETGVSWRALVDGWEGCVVHLTMKGENLLDVVDEVGGCSDVLVVVGSEKVPPEIYRMADYNVAITDQPHSEAAATAIFLDRLLLGEPLRGEA